MSAVIKAAALQLELDAAVQSQLAKTDRLIAQAVASGATIVVLPERFAQWTRQSLAETLDVDSPCYLPAWLATQARRHAIYLVGGSVLEPNSGSALHYNTCLVHGPDGGLLAKYRKVHLFDAMVDGVVHGESASILPGTEPVWCETPAGTIGLSICYDLRFPELYRALADRHAQVLTIPAGFTRITGRAHWEVLVRARAIENQCYVIAAGMSGYSAPTKDFYGHSMIVDPWGTVLAELSEGDGIALADIDLAMLEDVRSRLPALANRRMR